MWLALWQLYVLEKKGQVKKEVAQLQSPVLFCNEVQHFILVSFQPPLVIKVKQKNSSNVYFCSFSRAIAFLRSMSVQHIL